MLEFSNFLEDPTPFPWKVGKFSFFLLNKVGKVENFQLFYLASTVCQSVDLSVKKMLET